LEDSKVNIVLFGPPGAGKGTQAYNLVKEFKMIKVSTGDLLREEVKKRTTLGKNIESIIDKGLLVSDQMINDLIEKILSNNNYTNRVIFDGYPRTIDQAKNLDYLLKKNNQKISCVLSLKVDKEVVIKRILGRQICSKCGHIFNKFSNPSKKNNHKCDLKYLNTRSDDNENTIRHRFETYTKETLPILDYYRSQNLLHQIDGMLEIDKILEEIRGIIHSL